MKHQPFLLGLVIGLGVFVIGVFFIGRVYSRPTGLGRAIAESDAVIATNRNDTFSIVLTNGDVLKIVRAIATANRGPLFMKTASSPSLQLEFYKGTNFLASVASCGEVFWADETEYFDQSGALMALMNEFLRQTQMRAADKSGTLFLPTNTVPGKTKQP